METWGNVLTARSITWQNSLLDAAAVSLGIQQHRPCGSHLKQGRKAHWRTGHKKHQAPPRGKEKGSIRFCSLWEGPPVSPLEPSIRISNWGLLSPRHSPTCHLGPTMTSVRLRSSQPCTQEGHPQPGWEPLACTLLRQDDKSTGDQPAWAWSLACQAGHRDRPTPFGEIHKGLLLPLLHKWHTTVEIRTRKWG